MMIKLFKDWLEGLLDICKILNPSCWLFYNSVDINSDLKGVSVQSSAFMIFRKVRQEVGSLKSNIFIYFHRMNLRNIQKFMSLQTEIPFWMAHTVV